MRFALVALVACSSPGGAVDAPAAPHADAAVDAPPAQPSHAVRVIVEPDGMGGAQLVAALTAATHAIDLTMYELDDSDVIAALVARKHAGVTVQVILDGATLTRSFNTPAYNQLKAAGVAVVWSSPTFAFTHEKTAIIDGATAWIMTMNATRSAPGGNREYLAIDTEPTDVAEATAVFDADHALQAIAPAGPLVVANTNARPRLVGLIDAATRTLDLEAEEFSDSSSTGVVRAVVRAGQRGVTVHVVLANTALDADSVTLAKNGGGKVVVTGPTSGNGTAANPYIHAKAIVVDGQEAFVGSENFSAGSLGYNRELGVIFDTPAEVARVKAAIDADFARGVAQ